MDANLASRHMESKVRCVERPCQFRLRFGRNPEVPDSIGGVASARSGSSTELMGRFRCCRRPASADYVLDDSEK